MAFSLILNGNFKELDDLGTAASLQQVVEHLGMRADRIAVEHNGQIVPRTRWAQEQVLSGDKLEVVHFVGGGCGRSVAGTRPVLIVPAWQCAGPCRQMPAGSC